MIMLTSTATEVTHITVDQLHSNFEIDEENAEEIKSNQESNMINKHLSIFKGSNGKWYYLNPDLTKNEESVTLCLRCCKDPLSYPYSIASGHDYNRLGDLLDLNLVAKNALLLVRMFGQTVHLNSKTCSGYVITFDSNGPQVCSSSMLEALDENCIPHVTFVGSKEKWRIEKQKHKNLCSTSAPAVFSWLDVLCNINSTFIKKNIQFNDKSAIESKIKELNENTELSVIVTCNEAVSKLDELKLGDRHGEDEIVADNNTNDNDMLTRELCLVNENECFSNENENTAKHIVDILKLKKTTDNEIADAVEDNETANNIHVWLIEKGDDPLCEWTKNDVLVGSYFPFLFLRGHDMLPKSTFSIALIKHLCSHHNGRFENTQVFTHLLFNQFMRHTAIRKIARTESSNKKYLEHLGNLLKRDDFKEALHYAASNPKEKSNIALNNKLMELLSFIAKDLPFSAFERLQSKAKFSGMSMTCGCQSFFLTAALSEQDDMCLLKLHLIRKSRNFNGKFNEIMFKSNDFN